jgi:hypothetical protein
MKELQIPQIIEFIQKYKECVGRMSGSMTSQDSRENLKHQPKRKGFWEDL